MLENALDYEGLKYYDGKSKEYIEEKVTDLQEQMDNKVDKVDGKELSTNDFTDTYKTKLDGIEENANNYRHPILTPKSTGDMGDLGSALSMTMIKSISSDGYGHIKEYTTDNFIVNSATQEKAGLMSATDKTKLDGIATGANAITVDSALSSTSTNPVQNKVINTALAGKANSSHGNHVPTIQTANNAIFLRNDNTWQTVTPANIGAAAASHGTHVTYGASASALGTSSAGSATTVSRSDHVHALPALTSCTGTLTLAKGGTGATDAATARTNLGLGTAATYAATTSIASGGTGLITSGAVYTGLSGKAPTAHATTALTYGGGTASNYGHVKLSDSYTTSAGAAAASVAASSKALADAYTEINSNLNIFPDYANSITLYETDDIPNGDSTFSITIPETAYYTAFIDTFDTNMRPFIRITINSKVIFQGYNANGIYMYLQSPLLLLKKGTVAMFNMEGSIRKITKIPICTEVWQK